METQRIDEAIKTIATALREDEGLAEAWMNATAGILSDHQVDTPEQRQRAAKDVLSLLLFHPGPNPWGAMPGVMNGDGLDHILQQSKPPSPA